MKKITKSLAPIGKEEFKDNIIAEEGLKREKVKIENRVFARKLRRFWSKDSQAATIALLEHGTPEDKKKAQRLIKRVLVAQKVDIKQIKKDKNAQLQTQEGYKAITGALNILDRILRDYSMTKPLYTNWLEKVFPTSTGIAARLIYETEGRTFPSRSHLEKRFLMHTVNGRAARRVKGQSFEGDPKRKALVYMIGRCLIMKKVDPYYNLAIQIKNNAPRYADYLERNFRARDRATAKKKNPKTFIPSSWNLAQRKIGKLFLDHLWDILWTIQNPEKLIPRPMHAREAPLEDDQIITPPSSGLSIASYMSKEDSLKYYRGLSR